MPANPAIQKLRQRIASLEDVPRRFSQTVPITEPIDHWLPFGGLPVHCIHEVKGASLSAAVVFAAILSARIAGDGGNILFISPDRSLYPLGLLPYAVRPDQILHVAARRPADRIWAVMEALRCSGVGSVIAFVDDLDLTESRRLHWRPKPAERRDSFWAARSRVVLPPRSHDGSFLLSAENPGTGCMNRYGRSISAIAAADGRGNGFWNGAAENYRRSCLS